jgi:hypothetical protein
MAKRNKRRNSIWRNNLLILSLVLVLLLAIAGYALAHRTSGKTNANETTGPSISSNINYGPPTSQDKQDVQNHKNGLPSGGAQNSPPTDSSGKKNVTPIVTEADQSQVTAFVPGIFEEGGSCVATFTKDSAVLTKTVQGFANATYTSCAPFNFSGSFFPTNGQWSVTVAYKSTSAEGTSSRYTFEVNDVYAKN